MVNTVRVFMGSANEKQPRRCQIALFFLGENILLCGSECTSQIEPNEKGDHHSLWMSECWSAVHSDPNKTSLFETELALICVYGTKQSFNHEIFVFLTKSTHFYIYYYTSFLFIHLLTSLRDVISVLFAHNGSKKRWGVSLHLCQGELERGLESNVCLFFHLYQVVP